MIDKENNMAQKKEEKKEEKLAHCQVAVGSSAATAMGMVELLENIIQDAVLDELDSSQVARRLRVIQVACKGMADELKDVHDTMDEMGCTA